MAFPTGRWSSPITQAILDALDHHGNPMHFKRTQNYVDHDGTDTGGTTREYITSSGAMTERGIYISGDAVVPDIILPLSLFPPNPPQKPDRLQDDLDNLLKDMVVFQSDAGPGDEDYEREFRHFWVVTHVYAYDEVAGHDFAFAVSDRPPRPNWWKR
jgi:hypothetical protein